MVLYKNTNIVWTGVSKTPKTASLPPPLLPHFESFTNHLYRSHGMASESRVNDYRLLVFKLSLFHLNTRLLKLAMIPDNINKMYIY